MRNTLPAFSVIAFSVLALSGLAAAPAIADTPPDFNAMKAAAERGDPGAQSALGDAYADDQNGHRPDIAEAQKWYLKSAAQGYTEAAYALGQIYDAGTGVAQDKAKAATWYRQAAESGHAGAEYMLGNYYEQGAGMPQDITAAAGWYQQAACQGDVEAARALSSFYAEGTGLPKDPMAADFWARAAMREEPNSPPDAGWLNGIEGQLSPGQVGAVQSSLSKWQPTETPPYVADAYLASLDGAALQAKASSGDLAAQYALGSLYNCGGRGLHRDDAQALNWIRSAANGGFAPAQVSLGWYFEHGKGVEEDDTVAERWYQTAAAHGSNAGRLAYAHLTAPSVDPPETTGGAPVNEMPQDAAPVPQYAPPTYPPATYPPSGRSYSPNAGPQDAYPRSSGAQDTGPISWGVTPADGQ